MSIQSIISIKSRKNIWKEIRFYNLTLMPVPKRPFIFFSEIEIKKSGFNTSLALFSEIEIKKLEINNSLILILHKWSKSRRKLFTQTCLNNYQIVGVKTLLFIVLTWLMRNLAKWKKEIHASSVHFSEL